MVATEQALGHEQKARMTLEEELAEVRPLLTQSAAIGGLTRLNLDEIRKFRVPPPPVRKTLEMVYWLLQAQKQQQRAEDPAAHDAQDRRMSDGGLLEGTEVSASVLEAPFLCTAAVTLQARPILALPLRQQLGLVLSCTCLALVVRSSLCCP